MSIKSQIEALLFVVAKPLPLKQLAELLSVDKAEVEVAARELAKEYQEASRGLAIIENDHKFQMVTAAEHAELVSKLFKSETSGELSRPSLEALTIIAYRGPIAKSDLDRIRGVNCAMIVRNLLLRGLIETKESKDSPEAFYVVSFDFLRHLGVNSVEELPDYQRLCADAAVEVAVETGSEQAEDAEIIDEVVEEVSNNEESEEL